MKDGPAAAFEPHRRHLLGLAYRMLGSLAEAEDVVQEAYLRWHRAERGKVVDTRAFLTRITTRLALDQLKSARRRRETYVGPWLPEPLVDEGALAADSASDYADDLSVALLLTLERLSPLERAAFILHDVFDLDFTQVAAALGRGEAACRQLAARARAHVRSGKSRFAASPEATQRLVAGFFAAAESGDSAALAQLLAADAVLLSDGGGRRRAALNPIRGADNVARFVAGLARKREPGMSFRPARINGLPGCILRSATGELQTVAFEIEGEAIAAIYLVLNPEKLRGVAF